ncbi:MAG: hypothetical protein ABW133_06800 [Polyangiaceae bacterium]
MSCRGYEPQGRKVKFGRNGAARALLRPARGWVIPAPVATRLALRDQKLLF